MEDPSGSKGPEWGRSKEYEGYCWKLDSGFSLNVGVFICVCWGVCVCVCVCACMHVCAGPSVSTCAHEHVLSREET